MKEIVKPTRIEIEGKVTYLKKSPEWMGGNWRVVYPIKNDDGTWNLFNLFTGGSLFNLVLVILTTLIFSGFFMEYSNNISTLMNCFSDPIQLQACAKSFGTGSSLIVMP